MLKVVVTGPESSGKTTLCKKLSKYFKTPYVEEYARFYLTKLVKKYNQNDLLKIAKGQLKNEKEIINNGRISIYDTDLITIKIWSNYKYGNCDKWILDRIKKQQLENRLYLLCKPDIAWEPDPLRENRSNRDILFRAYIDELTKDELRYMIIEGENRLNTGIKEIESYIL